MTARKIGTKKTGRKNTIDFETVREMGLALPGVTSGLSWNSPALKVRDKMFAVIPTNRSSEPDSVALMLSFEERDALLEADPATYYLPEHYVTTPCILVRLTRVHRDALEDLVKAAWRFKSAGRSTVVRAPRRASGGRLRSRSRRDS